MTQYLKQLAATALLLLVPAAAAMASNRHLNLPAGTNLPVRISEHLNSEKANVGYSFHGTLAKAVVVNGRTWVPNGAGVCAEAGVWGPFGRPWTPGGSPPPRRPPPSRRP